jgi:hypothetical protein
MSTTTESGAKSGYAITIIDRQGFEGWTTLDPSGTLHIEGAKLRVSDATQPDGVRRQPILSRTFSRSIRYEIRWLREKTSEAPREAGTQR